MGIDKPTVRLVVHWTLPPTPESYYQEAGRAGRDGRFARCVLLYNPADATMHRSQLEVTFPPRELCEKLWSEPEGSVRASRSVKESAERLRRELRPERGGVDWRPVAARQARAISRLDAMVAYATGSGCYRGRLVRYFGEALTTCAGCARCARQDVPAPLDDASRKRFKALRAALAPLKTPWGGAVLEPEVIARLAESPPTDAATLAAVPGVGPELTARLGGRILEALGVRVEGASDPAPLSTLHSELLSWRAARALAEGVQPWQVLTDLATERIATAAPTDLAALATAGDLGPRALAAFGAELLDLLVTRTGVEGAHSA